MAFQNCDVNKLENSINKVDNINYDNINDLINSISYNEWQSPSEKRVITALKSLVSEYKEIQSKLDKYRRACTHIEQYKELESELGGYNDKLSSYKSRLKKCDDEDNWTKDYLDGKVDTYQTKIANNKSKMQELVRKASDLVL